MDTRTFGREGISLKCHRFSTGKFGPQKVPSAAAQLVRLKRNWLRKTGMQGSIIKSDTPKRLASRVLAFKCPVQGGSTKEGLCIVD